MKIIKGDFIKYQNREVGVVKETVGCNQVRAWYNIGGTSALTSVSDIERIDIDEVINGDWQNIHAVPSLIERQKRVNEGRHDVTDLIDERHIREEVIKLLVFRKG